MPTSVETIRSVTIRGRADGVDQATDALNKLTASIRQANDNLAKSQAAGQAGGEGYRSTGEQALVAANHLRQAAEAAYVFSPAFRGVINEMRAPALAAASAGIEAVAVGLVKGTNLAGTGLIALAGAAEKVAPQFLGIGASVRSAGIAMEAFSPTVGGAAASVLGFVGTMAVRFLPIVGWILLARDAINLVREAWTLSGEELAKYVGLSKDAADLGLTPDYLQQIRKAAEDAKLPVDQLTDALKKMKEATGDQLGGTSAQNRLKDLLDVGNFKGNSGVGLLVSATTMEEKFHAIVTLIDQAMQKGERLAALDIAKSFLGDQVAANLARDSDYLKRMEASAGKIKADTLVSQASVDNAVALQNRLDAAEKILSQRWHPIQEALINLGIEMRRIWVGIVESIASAVDWAGRLVEKLNEAVTSRLKLDIKENAGSERNQKVMEMYFGQRPTENLDPMEAARSRLAIGLQNPANIQSAADQVNAIQNSLFKDTSKDPAKKIGETASAYDRATESVLKYIEVTKAEAATVGLSVAEQEKAKVVAQLTAAAMKDGTPITAALRTEMAKLGEQAGEAALALEKARIAADIKFNRSTALLSQQDVQIATALKGIYPDVSRALNSVEASAMRTNNALRTIGTEIENDLSTALNDIATGSKSAGAAFTDMGKAIIAALEKMIIQMLIIQPLMRALGFSSGGAFGGGLPGTPGSAFYGPAAPNARGNIFSNDNLVPFANGGAFTNKIVDSPTLFKFASGAALGVMGEAGPEAIMPLKRSANGALGVAASGGGGQTVHITYAPNNDFRGADAAVVAKLLAQQAEDQKKFEGRVQAVFVRMKNNHPNLLR